MKKSVNLLPPAERKENRFYQINQQLINFGVWLGLSLVVLIVVLFAAQILTKRQLTSLNRVSETKAEELIELEQSFFQEEVVSLNANLENFETLSAQHLNWSDTVLELGRVLPKDVTLDNILVSREDYKVEIKGRAGDRDSVLILRKNLLASAYFRNVNFPLSNLESPSNVEWYYRFFVNPEMLK